MGCSPGSEPTGSTQKGTLSLVKTEPSLDRAKTLFASGRLAETIDMAQSLLKKEPKHVELRLLLGQSYSQQKEGVQALREFDVVLELRPKHAKAMELKALELRRQNREKDAEQLIQELLKVRPKHLGAWRELARVYQKTNQWQKAKEVASTMTRLAPYSPDHFIRLARACIQLNELDAGSKALKDALQRAPRHTKARAMLAGVLTDSGHFLQAMEQAQVLIEIDPDYPNASQLFELAAFMQVQWELGCKHGDGPYAQEDVKAVLSAYEAEGLQNAQSHYPQLVSRYGNDARIQAQLKFARRHCPTTIEGRN